MSAFIKSSVDPVCLLRIIKLNDLLTVNSNDSQNNANHQTYCNYKNSSKIQLENGSKKKGFATIKTHPIATSHFQDNLALNGFLVTAISDDMAVVKCKKVNQKRA